MTNLSEKARIGRMNALSGLTNGFAATARDVRHRTQARHNPVTFISARVRMGAATIPA